MREINYLSFGSPNEIEVLRQLQFCNAASDFLNAKFNFYLFLFPDDEKWEIDDVTVVRLDEIDHFFETLGSKIDDTIVVNHAFFYPYIKEFIAHEQGALIYHKIDIEYVFMKKIGLEPTDYNYHRKMEVILQSKCDWLYTSSELLVQYMMDNDGYHEHKNSLIPSIGLQGNGNAKIETTDVDETLVRYIHIGPVSNRGIKYLKKVLNNEDNSVLVLTDESKNLMKQGFARNDRFKVVPFTRDNIQNYLQSGDYCVFRPKPDISSWLRLEPYIYECVRAGLKMIIPNEYKSGLTKIMSDDIIVLESCGFELPKLNSKNHEGIKERSQNYTDIESTQNQLKFRNLKNIHNRRVSK